MKNKITCHVKSLCSQTSVSFYQFAGNLFFCSRCRLFSVCLYLLATTHTSPAQQVPSNLGFESGTFNGWTGATGQCCPVYTPQSGIDTNRHVITTGNFTDPYSNGLVDVVAPGSLFSARLGNDSGSAESEILDYNFTVPSDSLLLVLRFAVILENGNHPPVKQPRFGYEISNSAGTLEGCLSEQIKAGDTTFNFILNGSYEILNWQTRVINLTGLQGTGISIHFETGDCEPGGHFGYAYVDGELKEAIITGTPCNPDGSITLFAPPGLNGMWFNGSQADSIQIAAPMAGFTYTFDIAHENGCTVTLSKKMNDAIPESNFSAIAGCDFQVEFQNNSVCDPGSVYQWDFGDGQTNNNINPTHNYNGPGTYEITLTVQQPNLCISGYSETITLHEGPVASFSTDGNCPEQPITFTDSSHSGTPLSYSWFIDNQLACTTQVPEPVFYQPGTHTILLIVTDATNCTDSASTEIVIENFEDCQGETPGPWAPNAFTPNGDGINDFFELVATPSAGKIKLTVFDRFGEIVFSGIQWDGNKNGSLCPAGIYGYCFNYRLPGPGQSQTGTVMLVR